MAKSLTSKSEKKLWLVTGSALSLLFVVLAWMQWLNAESQITYPTVKIPQPNAWDFYVRADKMKPGNAAGMTLGTLSAAPGTPPGPRPGVIPGVVASPPLKSRYSMREKEQLLVPNQPALNMARQGFKYECQRPHDYASEQSKPYSLPTYLNFRELTRIFALEAEVRTARGDYAGAFSSHMDGMKLGADSTRGGSLIPAMSGIACETLSRRGTWELIDKLDATQARNAAQRLEHIGVSRQSLADIWRHEKYVSLYFLQFLWTERGWRKDLAQLDDAGSEKYKFANLWQAYTLSKRAMVYQVNTHHDNIITELQKPFAERKNIDSPKSFMRYFMVDNSHGREFLCLRNATEHELLTIAVALHAYKLEHQQYPNTLSQLVPRYLSRVPADPFDHRLSFAYRKTAAKYLLYSIGPDGRDDGGRPALNTRTSSVKQRPYYVQQDSRGDIVAGINVGQPEKDFAK